MIKRLIKMRVDKKKDNIAQPAQNKASSEA